MSDNDAEFLDDNEQRFNQKIDYNVILMNQIDKVRLSGSVEFRGGYWEKRDKMINGSLVSEKVYIPDTRQVYIGAIEQLFDLLIPYLDDDFNNEYSNETKKGIIQKRIKDLNDKREEKEKELSEPKFNVWYYSELLKIKRDLYRQLIYLISRMGMLGIKKSKEVY